MAIGNPGFRVTVLLLVSAACLVACGGGGSGGAAPAPPVTTPSGTAPVAASATLSTDEDTPLTGTLSAQDAEGDPMSFGVTQTPLNGTVVVEPTTGQFTYTPRADFSGSDGFSFSAADRRLVSAPARVTIQVSSINDPPVIQVLKSPGAGESGKTVSATLQVSDPETRVASYEVTFADGSTVPGLSMRPEGFDFPLAVTDHPVTLQYRVRVFDTDGNVTQREFTTIDCPVSASGNVVTLAGDVASPGVQWVITGDGYTASERQNLLQQAFEAFDFTLSQPTIARHRAGWNVHVVMVASAQSGADIPSRGFFRDTAFDGRVECGLARLACVDWAKVHERVLPEIVFDELLVILNSQERAGSGASDGAVVSYGGGAGARVALHELGHTFADLADEYVDADIAPGFAAIYVEGAHANVTRLTDPQQIPWRHWFADPARIPTLPGESGIGRFAGSYYHSTGYYRPADQSFMRDDSGPVTVVHAEAWVRALHDHVDPANYSHPAPGNVAMHATARTFTVPRVFPASVQSLRWYLDGVEDASARDDGEYACCTGLSGRHTLQASFADITEVIRAPGATEGSASVRWDLDIDPDASGLAPPQKAQAYPQNMPARGVIVRMRVDGSGHHVVGLMPTARPMRRSERPATSADSIRFTLTDAADATLATGVVADPRILRGMLGAHGRPGHAIERLETGHYLIRANNVPGLRFLRIEPAGAAPAKVSPETGQDIARAQVFDLAPLLRE
ncbi:MAG TPA: M64 family metallopeptidase [Steroidobacteraceae bacterium]|nr:M64 family metallopeptidase [Steroidobacteraceae bacterium]